VSPIILALLISGPSQGDYLCNYAKITGRARATAVYETYDRGSRVIKRLPAGAVVYTCDEYRNEERTEWWYKVHFHDVRHPCPRLTAGLAESRAKRCRSGWAKQPDIDVLSG
jgi:hypothetical protein